MADERRAMYEGFNDIGKHSAEWVQIVKEFLKLAFACGHHEVSCPCSRCENRRMLSKYGMSAHFAKKRFMSNYLLWHQHGVVQPTVADELDRNDNVDRMDDMVADIGRGMTWSLKIHRWRCRISICSLPPQKKKCMMV
jgi:hypothetical protein